MNVQFSSTGRSRLASSSSSPSAPPSPRPRSPRRATCGSPSPASSPPTPCRATARPRSRSRSPVRSRPPTKALAPAAEADDRDQPPRAHRLHRPAGLQGRPDPDRLQRPRPRRLPLLPWSARASSSARSPCPAAPPTRSRGACSSSTAKNTATRSCSATSSAPTPLPPPSSSPSRSQGNRHGTYGTTLTANLTKALGNKRNLTGIEMTLSRRYSYNGKPRSYVSAGCPAPKGFPGVTFPLARTSFSFAGGMKLTSTLTRDCKVRG